jgi:hypothetical protein
MQNIIDEDNDFIIHIEADFGGPDSRLISALRRIQVIPVKRYIQSPAGNILAERF